MAARVLALGGLTPRREARRVLLLMGRAETGLQADLLAALDDATAAAADLVEAGRQGAIDGLAAGLAAAAQAALVRRLRPMMEAAALPLLQDADRLEDEAAKADQPRRWSSWLLAAVAWLTGHAAAAALRFAGRTLERLREEIAEGFAAGEGERQIAARIRELLPGGLRRAQAQAEARRIARTESAAASSHATDTAARQTGIALDKTWIATDDDRTRASHRAADRQTVGMEQLFEVGVARLAYPAQPGGPPQEVINCRCRQVYRPRRDANGRLIRATHATEPPPPGDANDL